ncbi:hypothetical protein FRB94_013611 [Tulasnella sp. JGI-2019a]|nr:hypothetical protein FRB94_013611 [Tulasnella sp. JGI-2019a]
MGTVKLTTTRSHVPVLFQADQLQIGVSSACFNYGINMDLTFPAVACALSQPLYTLTRLISNLPPPLCSWYSSMETLKYKGPLQPLETQALLELIAGCIIVADHCFWITERDADKKTTRSNLQQNLKTALRSYKAIRQEAVMDAIIEAFPETDLLSLNLSLAARMNLDRGKGKEREIDRKATDLNKSLAGIVMQYRILMQVQPVAQGASGSTL